jgi:hypothetical protein
VTIPFLPNIPDTTASKETLIDLTRKDEEWVKDLSHITIDWCMTCMDQIYSASFYSFIRDEKNVDLSSVRLARIIKDYKPRQVALALRWLTQGWSVESTSRLMRNIFADWLPDLAACVFTLMSKDWPVKPQLSLCVAYLLINEPPAVSGVFLRTLTSGWTHEKSIELVSYLDSLLEWDEAYFHELIGVFSESTSQKEGKTRDALKKKSMEKSKKFQDQVLDYLSNSYAKGTTEQIQNATVRLSFSWEFEGSKK